MHAHIEIESRDCDGRQSRSYVSSYAADTDKGKEELVAIHAPGFGSYGTLEVTPHGVSIHMNTEEGYCNTEIIWCSDDCSEVKPTYRDHTAEAAGY